jgi:hypothetical protein
MRHDRTVSDLRTGEASGRVGCVLDALSAWWHMGTVKRAADLLSRSERTVINQLYSARNRNRVHTTVELVQLYLGSLRSVSELIMQHNENRAEASHRIRKAA